MILCCGEALIDMIPSPTHAGRDGFVPHAGGAIYNTAIALGRLGTPVGMLTGLSSDMFGQQLEAGLQESHVDVSKVITSDRPTTLAFVKLTDGHASYSFFDENSAGRMLSAEDLPELGADVQALYFGGISLACTPGADAYGALCAREGAGRLVMIDPNIRPGFIDDEAAYRARLMGMLAISDIVKVSDEDLAWLFPDTDGVQSLLDAGAKVVVLTLGSKGARAITARGLDVKIDSRPVEVVDTVGAGDTFNAGVLAALSDMDLLSKEAVAAITSDQLTQALTKGAQVAAVTVSRAGANPPWAEELAG